MKLPPFGKHLHPDAREIWIYFGGGGWNSARFRDARELPVLMLPPNAEPSSFRWPVDGREVLLIQQGQYDIQRIPDFANLLFAYGATIIRCIYGETLIRVVYYRREV